MSKEKTSMSDDYRTRMANTRVMFSGRSAVAGSAEEMVFNVVRWLGGSVVDSLDDEPNFLMTAKLSKKLEKALSKMDNPPEIIGDDNFNDWFLPPIDVLFELIAEADNYELEYLLRSYNRIKQPWEGLKLDGARFKAQIVSDTVTIANSSFKNCVGEKCIKVQKIEDCCFDGMELSTVSYGWAAGLGVETIRGSSFKDMSSPLIVLEEAEDCVFDGSTFHHLRGCFRSCSFKNVTVQKAFTPLSFEDCDLTGADFSATDVANVAFNNCTLDGAKMPEA